MPHDDYFEDDETQNELDLYDLIEKEVIPEDLYSFFRAEDEDGFYDNNGVWVKFK